jgi:hypothetical protein
MLSVNKKEKNKSTLITFQQQLWGSKAIQEEQDFPALLSTFDLFIGILRRKKCL